MINKRIGLFVVFSFAIVYTLFSCKKSSAVAISQHLIGYKIISNNYKVLSNISYTDTNGVQTVASAVDSTLGWAKNITTSINSLTAKLQVQGQNSSSEELIFTLQIYIDGVLAAMKQDSTDQFKSFNTQITAIAQ